MFVRLRRPAQVLFLLLALLFMGLLLTSQWDELRNYPWRLQPLWLAPSALCILASWSLEVWMWQRLLRLTGGDLAYGYAFRIWFLSAIIRYIPGNVWQPLGMTVLCHRRGVRPEATLTSVALYQVANLLGIAIIAAIYFPLSENVGLLAGIVPLPLAQLAVLVAIPVVLFLARPQWLIQALNWTLRRIGRRPLPVVISSRALIEITALAVLDWLILGTAFCALVLALGDFTPAAFVAAAPHLLAGYPLAYAVGYLSFITPSGLAVREGILYVLLAPMLGGGIVTVAALAMRLWLMLLEIAAAAASLLTWPGGLRLRRGKEIVAGTPADG